MLKMSDAGRWIRCCLVAAFALHPCGLIAGITATLGHHQVPVGSTDFQIPVMISGGDALTDFVGIFQVGDGGPAVGGTAAPKIKAISYAGSVWQSAAGGFSHFSGANSQIVESNLALNVAGQTVPGTGLLVTLIIDATGFPAGATFALKMKGTALGDSQLYHGASLVSLTVAAGSVTVAASGPPSAPLVSVTRLPDQSVRLSFAGASGVSYRVWWDADLVPPWTQVPGTFSGTGTTIQWTDNGSQTGSHPSSVRRRFYRVEAFR